MGSGKAGGDYQHQPLGGHTPQGHVVIAMAGRKAGFRHNEETRSRIKAQQLINRLQKHVDADEPLLDASQVNAAKSLLNKVLPDLKAIEHSGQGDNGEIIFQTVYETK